MFEGYFFKEKGMTVWQAVLQGLIQGLTEFLPVSSSGHLSLFQHFFGLNQQNALFFSVMLHIGTLIAVLLAFFRPVAEMFAAFFRMLGDICRGRFRFRNRDEAGSMVIMAVAATLPLLAFFFLKDFVSALAEDDDLIAEGVGFLVTGSLLFFASRRPAGKKTAVKMGFGDALLIGVAQGVASMPGISRSGSTVSAGMLRGYSREFMIRFSFILGIPAVAGSAVFEMRDALRVGAVGDPLPILAGMITAAAVGFAAIRLVQWLMRTDRFRFFAYYALLLGGVTIAAGALEKI